MLRTEFYSLLPIPLIVLACMISSLPSLMLVSSRICSKAVELRNFLHVKAYIHEVKNQDREKRKIPHRQGIREEFMEVWEDLVYEIYS